MKRSTPPAALALAGLCLFTLLAGGAFADLRSSLKSTFAAKSDAVITVEIVQQVKYSYGGDQEESERKGQSVATVVGADGLVIAPLSSLDPAQFYEKVMGKPDDNMAFSTRIKEIKYILSDNTEVPAMVVLRDVDQDLVLLRPVDAPEAPMTFVDLSDNATATTGDEAFALGRMGRIARRAPTAMSGEIQGVVTKPRPFYIGDSELTTAGTGSPVFNAEGKVLGINLLFVIAGGQEAAGEEEPVIPVIMPCTGLIEIVKQAPLTGEKVEEPAEEPTEEAASEDDGSSESKEDAAPAEESATE